MGERSNIFVRIRAKEKTSDKSYKHKAFFGLYYQWCYGERMISRLRSAIDFIHSDIDTWRPSFGVENSQIEKFKRYLAINFDMKDILEPVDLIDEAVNEVKQGYSTAEQKDIFSQEENHGYIYIDITLDKREKLDSDNKTTIKYAFVENEYHSKKYPLPPIMSVEQFADHDIGNDERKWFEPNPYWDERGMTVYKERFLNEIVPTAKKNIEEINKSASVMTEDERKNFVKFGREFTRKILREVEKAKAEIKEQREILTAEICSQEYLPAELHNKLLKLVNKVYPKPQKE